MRNKLFLISMILILLLAACGGDEPPEPPQTAVAVEEPESSGPTEPPPAAQAPTEAPPTEVPPTEAAPTEEPSEEDEAASQSGDTDTTFASIEHVADPDLVGTTWEWEARTSVAASEPQIVVPDPQNYTLQFNEDGTFNATLDCNDATGSYKTAEDKTVFMDLSGPMTLAVCGDESLDSAMMAMFGVPATYRFETDGEVLVIEPAADGPIEYFRDAGAVVEGEAEIQAVPEGAIQLDLQGLADSYSWQVYPASPIPPGPGGVGYPPHILLTFDGATAGEVLPSAGPYMYIFPTNAYINMYEAAGSSIVADQVARLQQLIESADGRQQLPESPMPLLPPPNSFMDRWVQFLDLDFGAGQGVRYVSDSPYRQAVGPWTNETSGYYYQGLTSGGTFYVSFYWPVSTEALPNTVAGVPEDVQAAATDAGSSAAYQQETKDMLNALNAVDWVPDLASLDAMVTSLTFPLPEQAADEAANGEEEEVELPEPTDGEAQGTVTAPDGVFIRSGPGIEYPDIGAVPFEETGTIIGVSEDGQWWVFEVPVTADAPEGQGWVSAQFVDAVNAGNVPEIPAPEVEPALAGSTWQWVSMTDPAAETTVPDPANYSIRFNDDGTAAIRADCNQVVASYSTQNESSISITLGPTTLAACAPESLDQQYLSALSNAAIYFFEEGDLLMDLSADGGTMRFQPGTAAVPVPPTSPGESGTLQFSLVSFGPVGAEQPVLPGTTITANFGDTEVSGFAGCNDYTASLTPVDDFFTVGPIATTGKICDEPAGVMEQETAYLSALGATSGFQWEQDENTLVTAGQVFYTLPDGTSGVLNYASAE